MSAFEDPQIITHYIGDVRVTLSVPAGCPVPLVDLTVHASGTTAQERAAAISALGLSDEPIKQREDTIWCEGRDTDGYRATVFLLPSDAAALAAVA